MQVSSLVFLALIHFFRFFHFVLCVAIKQRVEVQEVQELTLLFFIFYFFLFFFCVGIKERAEYRRWKCVCCLSRYGRMCSLAIEGVLLLQIVFSYHKSAFFAVCRGTVHTVCVYAHMHMCVCACTVHTCMCTVFLYACACFHL